jgi:hypothetical protein
MHAYVQPHVLASLCGPARARGQAATPLALAEQPAVSSVVSCTLVETRIKRENSSSLLLAASHDADELLSFSFVAA